MAKLPKAAGSHVEERKLNARTNRFTERPAACLSPAYVQELRRLISEDAYRSVEVADEIARRMLGSGDI
jgi:hypothetical protein